MSLLQQTVTVYRADGTRQVIENCQLTVKKGLKTDHLGTVNKDRFTLIVRGDQDLRPGDCLMAGIGPETVDFKSFLPEKGGCYRIDFVQPFFWNGKVSHMEAGGGYGT